MENVYMYTQNTATYSRKKYDHNIYFHEKLHLPTENCDHNIGPSFV
jgi:hypothetical protein